MRVALIVLAVCAACGGKKASPAGTAADASTAVSVAPPPPPRPELPPGTRSLRLIRTVAARLGPDEAAKRIGTVAQDTRVAWRDASAGPGCTKSWYAIAPQGWVCGDFLEASSKAPSGVELPRLDRGEMVPGTYGKVIEAGTYVYSKAGAPKPGPKGKDKKPAPAPAGPTTTPDGTDDDDGADDSASIAEAATAAGLERGRPLLGSVNVRKYAELTAAGKVFWKIAKGDDEYLPKSAIREHKPSTYQGVRLGDDTGLTLPLAFVWPRGGATKVWTHRAARAGGSNRQLTQRDAVPILETAQDNGTITAYRIGEGEWIDANQVRVAMPATPPAGVKPGERWIDVDLDQQLLIAYEGDLPVYATMVSTGLKDTPTETGIYRLWKKVAETDMKGLSGEDPYSVATVPWTQFFSPEKGLALHTAYWHDRFGWPKSHGCVNLAPQDARWLYFFSDPQVPPGWSMAAGVVEAPGSIVRVRSKADPDPPIRGYAQKVDDPDR